jgi:hypothetical protein
MKGDVGCVGSHGQYVSPDPSFDVLVYLQDTEYAFAVQGAKVRWIIKA